jgi:chemotaxis protein MotB
MTRRPGLFRAEQAGRDRWMVSYTDVMTILLILFVAVAAKAVQKPRSVPAPVRADATREALVNTKAVLESRGIRPTLEARGLVISLPQAILYPSGEDRVNPAALPLISEIAGVLRNLPNKVALVGHADAVPIHNGRFGNNWELSVARSLRLLELLTSRYGIPESRLAVSSDGSYNPRSPNDTAEGRAENRRVEIVILTEAPAG